MRTHQWHSRWVEEKVYFRGEDYFRALIQDIEHARHSVSIESYIFELDRAGRRLVRALRAAGRRGVKVRLMVDGLGNPGWSNRRTEWMEKLGIQVKVFGPAAWQQKRSALRNLLAILMGEPFRFKYMNRRNHRKVAIIDSKIGFVGGMNVSDDIFESYRGKRFWRDCMVKVRGSGIQVFESAFEAEWSDSVAERRKRLASIRPGAEPLAWVNSSRRLRRAHTAFWRRSLTATEEKLWAVTPYFAPSLWLLRLLRRARDRGLDVRVLLPETSDVFFMDIINGIFVGSLLRRGVRVFFFQKAILHAKVFLTRDFAIVGSSNWTRRSFHLNLEADVVVQSESSRKDLQYEILSALGRSTEMTVETWRKRRWIRRLFEAVLRRWIKWV
ncbi:MAG: hypothetical protein JNL01_04670 [Bdellovibrionales bacterium]|nr:hypothetical protein [Bdellovibrionales bacterium]